VGHRGWGHRSTRSEGPRFTGARRVGRSKHGVMAGRGVVSALEKPSSTQSTQAEAVRTGTPGMQKEAATPTFAAACRHPRTGGDTRAIAGSLGP
jgi:hypothetical protein